ncbi:hypothetical protein GCM10027180_12910 [Microbulbifer echini]
MPPIGRQTDLCPHSFWTEKNPSITTTAWSTTAAQTYTRKFDLSIKKQIEPKDNLESSTDFTNYKNHNENNRFLSENAQPLRKY